MLPSPAPWCAKVPAQLDLTVWNDARPDAHEPPAEGSRSPEEAPPAVPPSGSSWWNQYQHLAKCANFVLRFCKIWFVSCSIGTDFASIDPDNFEKFAY